VIRIAVLLLCLSTASMLVFVTLFPRNNAPGLTSLWVLVVIGALYGLLYTWVAGRAEFFAR
jgi:hypothetical protein